MRHMLTPPPASAQALVTPGTRLRPQTGPRLRPQVTPKATPAPTSKFPRKATPSAVSKSAQQQKAAAPLDRAQRFAAKFEHVSKHTGLKPEVNNGVQIRDSAWQQLLENSTSRADVEKVVEIMPRWPAMGRQFSTDIVNLLIRMSFFPLGVYHTYIQCRDMLRTLMSRPRRPGRDGPRQIQHPRPVHHRRRTAHRCSHLPTSSGHHPLDYRRPRSTGPVRETGPSPP
jgi:hypothetical protein